MQENMLVFGKIICPSIIAAMTVTKNDNAGKIINFDYF